MSSKAHHSLCRQEYLATVAAPPTAQQLSALARGAEVEGVLCVPKLVEVMGAQQQQPQRQQQSYSSGSDSSGGGGGRGGGRSGAGGGGRHIVRIVVSEGKKHEVRHGCNQLPCYLSSSIESLHRRSQLHSRITSQAICTNAPCRQVRILVAAAGMEITALHRTRIGGLSLPPDLRVGDYM